MRYEDDKLPTLQREFPKRSKYNNVSSGNRQEFLYTQHTLFPNDRRGFNTNSDIPFNTITMQTKTRNINYFKKEIQDFTQKRNLLHPQMTETLMLQTRTMVNQYPRVEPDSKNTFKSQITVGNEHRNEQIWDRKV